MRGAAGINLDAIAKPKFPAQNLQHSIFFSFVSHPPLPVAKLCYLWVIEKQISEMTKRNVSSYRVACQGNLQGINW
ncbi:hypothetical protein Ancab_017384 [Ancistrocladus abbreviatus]